MFRRRKMGIGLSSKCCVIISEASLEFAQRNVSYLAVMMLLWFDDILCVNGVLLIPKVTSGQLSREMLLFLPQKVARYMHARETSEESTKYWQRPRRLDNLVSSHLHESDSAEYSRIPAPAITSPLWLLGIPSTALPDFLRGWMRMRKQLVLPRRVGMLCDAHCHLCGLLDSGVQCIWVNL